MTSPPYHGSHKAPRSARSTAIAWPIHGGGRDGAVQPGTDTRTPPAQPAPWHLGRDRGPLNSGPRRDPVGPLLQPGDPGLGRLPVLLLVPARLGAGRRPGLLVRLPAEPDPAGRGTRARARGPRVRRRSPAAQAGPATGGGELT